MAKQKKGKQHRIFDERKQEFLTMFSKEAQGIRDSIVQDLPAYNAILSIHAESFEEIALRLLAEKRGVSFDRTAPPIPDCPFCRSSNVRKKEDTIYLCRDCKKTFAITRNSIVSGTKRDSLTWMKVLQCMIDGIPQTKTCEYSNIAPETYYALRNRLFYALQILLSDVKLYGHIEVDNTFVRASYKGKNLREVDCEEDSIFFNQPDPPRPPRKRGSPNLQSEKNSNSVCIFTAIDDHGHVMVRFAGIGVTNYRVLKSNVQEDKFLRIVPEQDPFCLLQKQTRAEPKTNSGETSLMIADKEGALKKYAESIGMPFEAHIYRREGRQMKLPEGTHNIQRVNALHSRLKAFLRDTNYVSTKYLPGYLLLFEFLELTGGSRQAMEKLFKIIATPDLGQSSAYYENMFSVPNYLHEWLNSDNPLSKIPPQKRLAFYLYHQMKTKEDTKITMQEIEQETGYTAPTIRKNYRELRNAGYSELIITHFAGPQSKRKAKEKKRVPGKSPTIFNPEVLTLYDEYAENRKLPRSQRLSLEAFLKQKNEQHGTKYTRTNMLQKFKVIEESGVRSPLPDMETNKSKWGGRKLSEKSFAIYEDYQKLVASYRERGEPVPPTFDLFQKLQEKYGLSINTLQKTIYAVSGYLKDKNTE